MRRRIALRRVIRRDARARTPRPPAPPQDTRLVEAVKAGEQRRGGRAAAEARPIRTAPRRTARRRCTGRSRNNDATLVDRLLRAGAKPQAANRYGVTPIALACESGSAAIVERLLKAGVSANATGPLGETALHTCARTGNAAAAQGAHRRRRVRRRRRELARPDAADVGRRARATPTRCGC